MPIIDTQDARDLDSHLQSFFDSSPIDRPHQLRQLFTEKFDFNPATGKVSLAKVPENVTLPSDADRIASIEGINVVYVPLEILGTTRVRKAEVVAAARVIAGQLGDDMLLLITNQKDDGETPQLHVILPMFVGSTPALRRMVIERDLPRRTVIQQLSNIYHQWQQKGDLRLALEDAFNVEAVTKAFFLQYHEVFKRVQGLVRGFPETNDGREAKKLFVQTLFNRLMFIYFLSRKGWLKFQGNPDYLAALWKDYRKDKDAKDFYGERLKPLFFEGLNNPRSADLAAENPTLHAQIGDVPFLNGGLFAKEDPDERSDITIRDEAFSAILHELFEHYNFTVTESTPLDQEVAVDPEMLGKVFEELVTGRHETGSYYTPRPVVSFMCRESLKGYLQGAVATLPTDAIESFVDMHDVSGLNLATAEAVRKALEQIKVVDPACGSGAYLLGMMHELVELETALYNEKLVMDPKSLYDLKLRIIEENVYGADIDKFAVNTAMLRLWLSLSIDYESFPPLPLPNLDFKIVCGDSLTAPDPNPSEHNPQYEMFLEQARKVSGHLAKLKHRHMIPGDADKHQLEEEIHEEMANLRAALAFSPAPEEAVDWRVEFAEVFDNTGFDIVLANPPYVRADAQFKHLEDEDERQAAIAKWKDYRAAILKSTVYQTLYEKWDLYLPFLERAYQLLSANGRMVFIISDAYNAAKYAQKSHVFFLNDARIERIDFCSDIPLFEAGISNTIIHYIKAAPESGHQPIRIKRWGESPDDFERNAEVLLTAPQAEFGAAIFRANSNHLTTVANFVPLESVCYLSWGLRPNSDDRYFQGSFTTKDMISDVQDKAHPKPFVQGKDTTKWWAYRIRYLEWDTERAPAMFARPTFPELYDVPEKLLLVKVSGISPKIVFDNRQLICTDSFCCCVPWHYLKGIRNKSIRKTAKYQNETMLAGSSNVLSREQLEEQSRQFAPKYLLAIANSAFAHEWLASRRRHKIQLYPDDWRQLPIVPATQQEQASIVALVDQILELYIKHSYPLTPEAHSRLQELEQQIDKSVAKLYGG